MDRFHPTAYGAGDRGYVVSQGWPPIIIHSSTDCVTAVNVSVKDQLTLSSGVAIGSTIVSSCSNPQSHLWHTWLTRTTPGQQLSLFVIPSIVIVAWMTRFPLGLLFDPFESVALYLASTFPPRCSVNHRQLIVPCVFVVHTMNYVVADGRSNWMEGFILICMSLLVP